MARTSANPSPVALPGRLDIEGDLRLWCKAHPQLAIHLAQGVEPAKALRHLGLTAWGRGEVVLAADVLKAAAALRPDDAAIWGDLAGAYYAGAQPQQARTCILQSLERNKREPGRWLFLAGLYRETGQDMQAERAFLEAVEIDPLLQDAWIGLGILYFQQRRFAKAAEALGLGIRHGSRNMTAYHCLGEALYLQGDIAGARAIYAVQIEAGQRDAETCKKFAFLCCLEALIAGPVEAALALYATTAGVHGEDRRKVVQNAFHVLSGYGYTEAAIRCGRAYSEDAPDDPIPRYLLAALAGAPVTRAPEDYLISYFDQFAESFDQRLVDVLDYHVPQELWHMVASMRERFQHCLDAGCGTGLAGPLLRAPSDILTGVDLSPRMLEKAAERKLYDELIEAEINAFLARTAKCFDLVFAADVLIYIGDVSMLMANAARRLVPGGLFAFSIETTDTAADYAVLASGRFAHRPSYIEAGAQGLFRVERCVETQIRLDATGPIAGAMFVLRRLDQITPTLLVASDR